MEWRELESLVDRSLKQGLRGLTEEELYRLPILYRSTMASLSIARRMAMDRHLVAYLEGLAARAYLVVYGSRRPTTGAIRQFFAETFPRQVQSLWMELTLATLILTLGVLVGFTLTRNDPAWFYAFVSKEMASGRTPDSTREELREPLYAGGDQLVTFASFLFTHNARIGMMSFALGIAAGAPTALLVFVNGLTLGPFLAIYADDQLLIPMLGWLLPHGIPEIAALLICAAGGLHIGRALIWPGRHYRKHALKEAGQRSACVVLGAVLLFAIAGFIEGVFRQTVDSDVARYGMAAFNLAWLYLWLFRGEPAKDLERAS